MIPRLASARGSDPQFGSKKSVQFCALQRLSLSETPYSWRTGANRVMLLPDGPAAQVALGALIGLLPSSARREAEILVLRQQINVLRRKSPKRPALNNADRLLFVWLSWRRECLDHIIVFGEMHLRRIVGVYAAYYLL